MGAIAPKPHFTPPVCCSSACTFLTGGFPQISSPVEFSSSHLFGLSFLIGIRMRRHPAVNYSCLVILLFLTIRTYHLKVRTPLRLTRPFLFCFHLRWPPLIVWRNAPLVIFGFEIGRCRPSLCRVQKHHITYQSPPSSARYAPLSEGLISRTRALSGTFEKAKRLK